MGVSLACEEASLADDNSMGDGSADERPIDEGSSPLGDSAVVRALVAECLAGDQRAAAALIARFQGRIYGLCYRMLGHRHDAEDAVQETFVRAIRSLAQWDGERELAPWLCAIAANRCRTMLERRANRKVSCGDVDYAADTRPDRQGALQLAEEVDRALAGLREEHRQAFLLFHCEQLSYVEIGAALDVPLGTVKTWVHRARTELAMQLRDRGVVEGTNDAMR